MQPGWSYNFIPQITGVWLHRVLLNYKKGQSLYNNRSRLIIQITGVRLHRVLLNQMDQTRWIKLQDHVFYLQGTKTLSMNISNFPCSASNQHPTFTVGSSYAMENPLLQWGGKENVHHVRL